VVSFHALEPSGTPFLLKLIFQIVLVFFLRKRLFPADHRAPLEHRREEPVAILAIPFSRITSTPKAGERSSSLFFSPSIPFF